MSMTRRSLAVCRGTRVNGNGTRRLVKVDRIGAVSLCRPEKPGEDL